MDLKEQRRSSNIEDRRGIAPRRPVALGLGTIIAVVIIGKVLDVDPMQLLRALDQPGAPSTSRVTPGSQPNDLPSDFVAAVLGSTEDAWRQVFSEASRQYRDPKLVLFRDEVRSACGQESAATGPFYCPGDQQVYLDLSFFDELGRRFGAPGDFAQAYVIAHEVGHHVQNLLGINAKARAAQRGQPKSAQNEISVRLELQADCFAGVWANRGQKQRKFLEAGDVDEALRAAAAIGDDRLQRNARGRVAPETFTHGTSAQRTQWLSTGLSKGTLAACDTFATGAVE